MGFHRRDEFEQIPAKLGDKKSNRTIETWGRNLDSLAKSYNAVYSNNKSLTSVATVPSSAPSKTPRWIEFWSDLAEERSNSSLHISSPEAKFDLNFNLDLAKEPQYYNGRSGSNFCKPRWLMDYFQELTTLLINGGWNEQEINGMIQTPSSPLGTEDICLDNKTILEGLLLKTDSVSNSLRSAGWSSQDIAEIWDLDFPTKRPTKKFSPELAGKIGKLAENVDRG